MSRRLHPSVIIAEEANLLLSAVERLSARRGLLQADKAQLWPVLHGLREIRDRHRTNLGLADALGASPPETERPHAAPDAHDVHDAHF